MYYYRARYYDSVIERFMQKDPLGMVDGTNTYIYSKNNVVNILDPYGKDSWKVIGFSTKKQLNGIYYQSQKWKMDEAIKNASNAINKHCTKKIHGKNNKNFCNCLNNAVLFSTYRPLKKSVFDPLKKVAETLGLMISIYILINHLMTIQIS